MCDETGQKGAFKTLVITDRERNFLTLPKQKQVRHDKSFSAVPYCGKP